MLPKRIRIWTDPKKVAQNPAAAETICEIYERYYPEKERFVTHLNGQDPHNNEQALMKGLSPEDSVTFVSAMNRIKLDGMYVKRCGRGPRHGKYRSMLPVALSESFAVYVYARDWKYRDFIRLRVNGEALDHDA